VNFSDLVVLAPVYEDWAAVSLLLPTVDAELERSGATGRVVLVDDGSMTPPPPNLVTTAFKAIAAVHIVSLKRNLGHQRALAVGLAYVNERMPCDAVVVMDADGEDAPSDIGRMLAEVRGRGGGSVVFARRMRRSEGIAFTLLYRLYRWVHHLMTGIPVQVGNFSVIPFPLLGRLVVMSDLWNHYAAAVFQSRIPYGMVPTARARRLSGTSRMNFVSLVTHGMSAVAVFSDRVGVRLLIGSIVALGVTLAAFLVLALRWLFGGKAPSAATVTVIVVALVLFVQMLASASLFVLQVLFARGSATVIPVRDYAFFVAAENVAWRRTGVAP
jgi:hypothetical protein